MKITTRNVRGLCSRFRMHEFWRIVLSEQCDVLCAVEHKDHRNGGLISYCKGYTLCYAGNGHKEYSGIAMFIRDKFQPKVIVSDEFGRFIVVEICYEGQVLWLVGVYAPNVSQERKCQNQEKRQSIKRLQQEKNEVIREE